ncbi:small acid-soluble spore protein alpha/beta type [Orenia metallireducens]|uniref:Small, acid-soluble spore protein, alpha/beta type n=1 Tax=Orenia metallireducens TaxID=1413210 RepID=A0A285IAT4_9FIRM|nr:alpha/beta-type small acid-soluble spore protein [Orenia metallireducens]PRX20604.1 small acid-soluble spore protein alpha/beta type [Orenia metallireducens]SNY45104.1 Small, acid-soluble spore protein, alpha/beta type [Orenia metallireducens]
MSIRNNSNRVLNPMAMQALDKFKLEAATELNISNEYKSGYWGNITSRECGSVGGQMVKKMIQAYEDQLANGAGATNTSAIQNATTNDNNNNYNLAAKAGNFVPQG